MKSLFEPLLIGLYNVGKCPVYLLDSSGQLIFKKIPWGADDWFLSQPHAFAKASKLVRLFSAPVLLSPERPVGGYAFIDKSLLIVGPLTPLTSQQLCESCNLSFPNSNLSCTDFLSPNPASANLSCTDFPSPNPSSANLPNTNIPQANTTRANSSSAPVSDLSMLGFSELNNDESDAPAFSLERLTPGLSAGSSAMADISSVSSFSSSSNCNNMAGSAMVGRTSGSSSSNSDILECSTMVGRTSGSSSSSALQDSASAEYASSNSEGREKLISAQGHQDSFNETLGAELSRRSRRESKNEYRLRLQAVNTQLESIAWAARRLLAELTSVDKQAGADYLSELTEVRSILPNWDEVVAEEVPHSSYLYEIRSLDAITQGRSDLYIATHKQGRNGHDGTLGYTPLRSAQNLAICGIVLNSRAAVAGGLSVEQAYTMADYLILAVERCRLPAQADIIGYKSGVIYARMVHQLKEQLEQKRPPSVLGQRALELIRRSLFTKVSRKDIAGELKVNADYLDRVLKADFNATVMECLRHERIEEAKRLLVQSQTPIYEIAALLLFSHSSHFIKVFTAIVGVSPKEYRRDKQSQAAAATL